MSATYTLSFLTSQSDASLSVPLKRRIISYLPSDAVTTTSADFDDYRHTDAVDSTQTDALRIRKAGATGGGVVLTYVTYGIQTIGDGTHFLQRDYFVFGTPTTSVPTTGTADYSGIIDGTYNQSAPGQTYTLSGTATLHANFADATITTNLTFTGTNIAAGGPSLAQQQFNGTGLVFGTAPAHQFDGTFTGMGRADVGRFEGSFFGGHADEFGMSFSYTSATDQFSGIAVGKK